MRRQFLHICGNESFIPPFVEFIEDNFYTLDHCFWVNGNFPSSNSERPCEIYSVKAGIPGRVRGLAVAVYKMHKAKKVILHNLFNRNIILLLFFMPWLLKKCYWVIWGGDLYRYESGVRSWRFRFTEFIRRPVIKNMGHLVTYIPGDVELAREWYGAKGQYHECLMYLSNVVDQDIIQTSAEDLETYKTINILVGNSADPSNNHIESLEKLLPYKGEDIRIFAPLSYGDREHAKKVIETGSMWFGEKFVPLTSFLPVEEYLKFLQSVDIAIFNHNRQQAMGNTIFLLSMGKTVCLRDGVSHCEFIRNLQIVLNTNFDLPLKKINREDSRKNSEIAIAYFSAANLKKQLGNIFEV